MKENSDKRALQYLKRISVKAIDEPESMQLKAKKVEEVYDQIRAILHEAMQDDALSIGPTPKTTARASRAAAVNPLNPPGHWDFMISYTTRNEKAAALALDLYGSLTQRVKGRNFRVWLDKKMKVISTEAMKEAAQHCTCLIAIVSGKCLSLKPDELEDESSSSTGRTSGTASGSVIEEAKKNAYFRRPACLTELRAARRAGVPIQPVLLAEDKTRVGELLLDAPTDLRDLGDIEWVHLDQTNTYYWKEGLIWLMATMNKLVSVAADAQQVLGPATASNDESDVEQGGKSPNLQEKVAMCEDSIAKLTQLGLDTTDADKLLACALKVNQRPEEQKVSTVATLKRAASTSLAQRPGSSSADPTLVPARDYPSSLQQPKRRQRSMTTSDVASSSITAYQPRVAPAVEGLARKQAAMVMRDSSSEEDLGLRV
eukprot:COSAG01_NODE_4385_length_5079_cov_1.805622_5_plen_429_part_00